MTLQKFPLQALFNNWCNFSPRFHLVLLVLNKVLEQTEFQVLHGQAAFAKNEQQCPGNYSSFREIYLSVPSSWAATWS